MAHLLSATYAANAVWLAHVVIAFNLVRAGGTLTSVRHARARRATPAASADQRPGRSASSVRRHTLHLLRDWPWAGACEHPRGRHSPPAITAV